ncbi:hypothetical protein H2201_004478 [Coniosporium apollinis]|uniref:Chromosome transmission fidelity protein 4 n=1 Tax=Coniosporium apollinis TaxID=61459 RepID=A0ABQ9NSM3_9PEZI|nr:hypothetical protein H2201_004478 [Coniosporium apollinis]
MTAGLMRTLSQARLRIVRNALTPKSSASPIVATGILRQPRRSLANIREPDSFLSGVWFSSTPPCPTPTNPGNGSDVQPPDERTLKLGKTIRILHERLPTLLASPLPQEILSPQITLHLFPSTHPHLPTVTGRIAYMAALWTAPMAWGRVPVVGNVKLHILSERLVRNGPSAPTATSSNQSSKAANYRSEKLIVRWKTCGKTKGKGMGALYRGIGGSEQVDKITEFLGGDVRDDEEFCGLFIFEFDEEGRVVSHTIEHVEEGGSWDKMTKVISVTDWLLGKAWGKKGEVPPGLALGYCTDEADRHGAVRARRRRS